MTSKDDEVAQASGQPEQFKDPANPASATAPSDQDDEPTEEMISAGLAAWVAPKHSDQSSVGILRTIYKAMRAARRKA